MQEEYEEESEIEEGEELVPQLRSFLRSLPLKEFSSNEEYSTMGSLNRVMSHAIEYSAGLDMNRGTRGAVAILVAIILLPMSFVLSGYALRSAFHANSGGFIIHCLDILLGVFMAPGLLAVIISAIRVDWFGYADAPVILNRKTRKVHAFKRTTPGLNPFRKHSVSIETYDWECVHPEIHKVNVSTPKLYQVEYRLLLAFTASPQSTNVIGRVMVGSPGFYRDGAQVLIWEQIRRYMESNGDPLGKRDKLKQQAGRTFRYAVGESIPILAPRDREVDRSIFASLLSIAILPLTLLFILSTWMSVRFSRFPEWSYGILCEAGPIVQDYRY